MTERLHAKRSPSAFKYIKACPGFLPEQKSEEDQHENTLRGTRLHKALESKDYSDLDDKDLEWVEFCCATEMNIVHDLLGDLGASTSTIHEEIKVEVHPKYNCFGFTDKLYCHGTTGLLFDWKFGWGKVDDAEENDQGKGYALGIFRAFPLITTLHVVFVQAPWRKITKAIFYRKDLRKLNSEITSILKPAAECDDFSSLLERRCKTSEACLYCQRSKDLSCPLMTTALKTIQSKVENLTFPAEFKPETLPAHPDDLVRILRVRSVIDKLFDAASDRLKAMLEEGAVVEGAELLTISGKVEISDLAKGYSAAQKSGLTTDEWIAATSVSIPKLSKVLKEKAPRGQKDLVVEQFIGLLSEAQALTQAEPTKRLKITKQ